MGTCNGLLPFELSVNGIPWTPTYHRLLLLFLVILQNLTDPIACDPITQTINMEKLIDLEPSSE